MKKIIIWSLFDSETECVKDALSMFDNVEVYTIGLSGISGKNHDKKHAQGSFYEVDLSLYEKSINEIKSLKLPKPNAIFASPPCESWVDVSIGNVRHYSDRKDAFNIHWTKDFKPLDFTDKLKRTRILGEDTASTLLLIIKHFNPNYYFIENGRSSLIFKYLSKNGLLGYKNLCRYAAYNFNVIKPTIIYSNEILYLKKDIPTREYIKIEDLHCYKEKSKVPKGLYVDIYEQVFLNKNKQYLLF